MEKNEREKDAENQTELGAKLGARIPGSVWRHTKTGGYYWSGHTLEGFPRSISLKLKGKKSATKNKAIALQIQRQFWMSSKKNLGAPGLAKGLEKLLGEFEKLVTMEASATHAKKTVAMVRKFHTKKEISVAWNITTPAIQEYLIELRNTEVKHKKGKPTRREASTVTRYRAALSRWCQWLVYQGYLDANLVASVKPPRVQKRRPRFLTRKDQAKALRAARKTKLRNAMRFALATGVRHSELAALRGKDIRPNAVVIERGQSEEHTKTYRARTVPITPGIFRMVGRMNSAGDDAPFACTKTKEARTIMDTIAAAVPMFNEVEGRRSGRRWNLLRSTYAVMQARAGVGLWELMRRMGHSNPQTTMMYLDVAGVADAEEAATRNVAKSRQT